MVQLTRIPQFRIAVNARCGRACFYCRPSGEALPTDTKRELNSDDIVRICNAAVKLGVRAVKLTGGDPALWYPLVECTKRLKSEVGVEQLQVISRHPRIQRMVEKLAAAGLDLLNISLDTLNPDLHCAITGRSDLSALLKAIERCSRVLPCKINMVVMKGINETEIDKLIRFCEDTNIKSLKLLDLIRDLENGSETYSDRLVKLRGLQVSDTFFSLSEVVEQLKKRATDINTVYQGGLGHPMTHIHLSSGMEVIVKDHRAGAWYGSVCKGCRHFKCHDALMALRLTPDARLQFCLLREDIAVDLAPYLKKSDKELIAVMRSALNVYNSAKFLRGEHTSKFEAGTNQSLQALQFD